MAATRYYYSDAISTFLTKSVNEIVGELTLTSQHDINDETSHSWVDEIIILQDVLAPYSGRGSVYFEYNIPRMGRRADVIVIIDGIVFVLEFKTAEQKFRRDAMIQVWDYVLDLKNFQEGSLERVLVPILVIPKEKDDHCHLGLKHFEDNVYEPIMVNIKLLSNAFSEVLNIIPHSLHPVSVDNAWAKSGYEPTPTIIEAAIALYEENTVEDITKHGGDIDKVSIELCNIIGHCRQNNRKAICFITGVPGAGKTLIGLNTAIDQFNKGEKAVYLSGNFPLVEVLQEALTRDYVRRDKIKAKQEKRKACTKEEAKSKVKAFIQMIHHYRDLYLEGTKVEGGKILPIPPIRPQIKSRDNLHLKMSMRSFRSEKVSLFVNQLLALQNEEAALTLRELNNYPIVMTRSLCIAKQWLRVHSRGSERMGLLASSKAERLKAISINVRYQPDFVHWFLEDDGDIRSSNALEDTLTEFKVQGLEIDWACVVWDADLRLNKDYSSWQHYQLRSGSKWQNINTPINREYQINAYRVLLTRARQGMVIVVPQGNYGIPPDETRKPEWYDEIYNYLKEIGIREIDK